MDDTLTHSDMDQSTSSRIALPGESFRKKGLLDLPSPIAPASATSQPETAGLRGGVEPGTSSADCSQYSTQSTTKKRQRSRRGQGKRARTEGQTVGSDEGSLAKKSSSGRDLFPMAAPLSVANLPKPYHVEQFEAAEDERMADETMEGKHLFQALPSESNWKLKAAQVANILAELLNVSFDDVHAHVKDFLTLTRQQSLDVDQAGPSTTFQNQVLITKDEGTVLLTEEKIRTALGLNAVEQQIPQAMLDLLKKDMSGVYEAEAAQSLETYSRNVLGRWRHASEEEPQAIAEHLVTELVEQVANAIPDHTQERDVQTGLQPTNQHAESIPGPTPPYTGIGPKLPKMLTPLFPRYVHKNTQTLLPPAPVTEITALTSTGSVLQATNGLEVDYISAASPVAITSDRRHMVLKIQNVLPPIVVFEDHRQAALRLEKIKTVIGQPAHYMIFAPFSENAQMEHDVKVLVPEEITNLDCVMKAESNIVRFYEHMIQPHQPKKISITYALSQIKIVNEALYKKLVRDGDTDMSERLRVNAYVLILRTLVWQWSMRILELISADYSIEQPGLNEKGYGKHTNLSAYEGTPLHLKSKTGCIANADSINDKYRLEHLTALSAEALIAGLKFLGARCVRWGLLHNKRVYDFQMDRRQPPEDLVQPASPEPATDFGAM